MVIATSELTQTLANIPTENTTGKAGLGKRLFELRDALQLTQDKFAQFVSSNEYGEPLSRIEVSMIESGMVSNIKATRAIAIAKTCNVSLEWLIFGKGTIEDNYA